MFEILQLLFTAITTTAESKVEPEVVVVEATSRGTINRPQFIEPCDGHITQAFSSSHGGIDIANQVGTEVRAIASGVCTVRNEWNHSYGNHVVITHADGYKSLYAHLDSIEIEVDQEVAMGDVIGYMGSTGNSTGSHLHIEIYKDDERVNPSEYLM